MGASAPLASREGIQHCGGTMNRSQRKNETRDFKWYHGSAVYEIYVQSFKDSNGDGIGDLNGVTEKLDYIKELGVDAIWLSPIFRSPFFDCGYDCSDYYEINPDFGTMDDFRRLLEKAHEKGLRVILDLVLTYTSNEHWWFKEACKSRDSKYHDYYIFAEGKDGAEPNNQQCFISRDSSWTYNKSTDDYYYHFWPKEQVHLNWENPEVEEEMFRVVRHWLDVGVDGFRLDAINAMKAVKDLRGDVLDDEGNLLYSNYEQYQIHPVLKRLRKLVDGYEDRLLLAEVFPGGTEQAIPYYGNDDEFHLVFNFTFLHTIKSYAGKGNDWATLFDTVDYENQIPMAPALRKLLTYEAAASSAMGNWSTVVLGNHDQPRIASVVGGLVNDPALEERLAKWAAVFVLTLRGTPFIYNGEEIGMKSQKIPDLESFKDMHGRVFYDACRRIDKMDHDEALKMAHLVARDHCRTPMQWTDGKNAGFSESEETWLPIGKDAQSVNVESETADDASVLNFYKKMITIRNEYPALRYGEYTWLEKDSAELLVFSRELNGASVLVVLNCTEMRVPLKIGEAQLLLSNTEGPVPGFVEPFEASVYLKGNRRSIMRNF